jgi:hypothetical protein
VFATSRKKTLNQKEKSMDREQFSQFVRSVQEEKPEQKEIPPHIQVMSRLLDLAPREVLKGMAMQYLMIKAEELHNAIIQDAMNHDCENCAKADTCDKKEAVMAIRKRVLAERAKDNEDALDALEEEEEGDDD